MITIKAFDKGLKLKGKQYKVGETYVVLAKDVKLYHFGFHAAPNKCISNTLSSHTDLRNTEYALVDLNVIDSDVVVAVGDKMTILRKITSLKELVAYDCTGEWSLRYAEQIDDADVELLEDKVIEKDATGRLCVEFAKYVKNANKEKLQENVIAKDKTGQWCTEFARYVDGANIPLLEQAVINKDTTGQWIVEFALNVKGADITPLFDAILDNKRPEWIAMFRLVHGINTTILDKVLEPVTKRYNHCN